ncbi:protein NO VEIN domain-containing protein [Roseomonas mucosa]
MDDPTLYQASLAALELFTRGSYYGRLVQIFLACKHYGHLIPRVGDPQGVDVATMQRLLDELYDRPSLRPGPSVVSLFSNNHLYPTGVAGPGMKAGNIWRNNFNIQKGFGCYGTVAEIKNPAFRRPSRKLCPHLVTAAPNQLQGAHCDLEPTARYRREDHPKVFRIDPVTREHFVYDPSDVSHYAPLVLAPGGRRLPIAALIVALYHDAIVAGGRTQVDVADFLADFDFVAAEALSYFDDDPATPQHRALVASFPGMLSWTRISAAPVVTAAPTPLPGIPVPAPRRTRAVPAAPVASPPTAPPAGGHWWDAEQAVRQVLVADGWTVIDVSRLGVGYDLRAYKAGTTRHIEVKSSAGRCSPVLTSNELNEARRLRDAYVLAVVENFDPAQPVSVVWVQDPARLPMGARNVTVYSLPRSAWLPHAMFVVP